MSEQAAEIETWEYIEAEYTSHDAPGYYDLQSEGGIFVTIKDEDGQHGDWIVNAEIDPREGRIMAAGLEMLSALEAHDAYMLGAGYEGPESTALHPKAAENWRRVRAAIAKAKG